MSDTKILEINCSFLCFCIDIFDQKSFVNADIQSCCVCCAVSQCCYCYFVIFCSIRRASSVDSVQRGSSSSHPVAHPSLQRPIKPPVTAQPGSSAESATYQPPTVSGLGAKSANIQPTLTPPRDMASANLQPETLKASSRLAKASPTSRVGLSSSGASAYSAWSDSSSNSRHAKSRDRYQAAGASASLVPLQANFKPRGTPHCTNMSAVTTYVDDNCNIFVQELHGGQ